MPNEKEPWFVIDRSEALAGLLLTSREDVHVRSEFKNDDGVDFLVELSNGEPVSSRLFWVQVKGTTSPNPADWTQNVKQLFRPRGSEIYLPVCVFVVNVRDNRAYYAWLAEPSVEDQRATLRFPPGDFKELDRPAVDTIVDRVRAWYDVLPQQLTPA
jgi:hypothetical protein